MLGECREWEWQHEKEREFNTFRSFATVWLSRIARVLLRFGIVRTHKHSITLFPLSTIGLYAVALSLSSYICSSRVKLETESEKFGEKQSFHRKYFK